jgi:hypothetical protein
MMMRFKTLNKFTIPTMLLVEEPLFQFQ